VWTGQRPVHSREIERLGIKRSPDPFEQFVVPWVAGVTDRREELLVAGHPAAVLGRASTLAPQADRTAAALTCGEDPLDEDLVLPVVTEVVPVEEAATLCRGDIAEPHAPLRQDDHRAPLRVGHPIPASGDDELMEVAIGPAHGLLEDEVQAVKRQGAWYLKAAPDGWS
jgi:hypothetical protein